MQRIQLRKMCWLGLIGLVFLVVAVPAAVAQGKTAKTAEPAGKIDINNAAEKQLEDLPGVGKATANKIIAGRPYASVDDLAKAGVPKSTIAKIAPLVSVGSASTAPFPKRAVPAAATAAKNVTASAATPSAPPAAGMVWVNLDSKVYHKEGDQWYGKTKNGKYMTEADAVKAGYRPVKEKEKK